MTAEDLHVRIEANDAPAIVDVRSGWEFDQGHVPNAVHIPFWSIFWRGDQVPAGLHDPVVVYCEHGPRAGIARFALRSAGFTQVLYLQGHMARWRALGLPIDAHTPE
jgi:rhodanese-related sulfurtransferase